ncbi:MULTISPECIES: DeoR/GlpR family DNA-binding transcription regulator [unclassified Oceanobacillus]|uniref:DeoR/GlpR family DNA-binding transcription regulator n=1 Tax=unclassified Oceanobacillus TaxID=2630292 RepID=UPI00300DC53F
MLTEERHSFILKQLKENNIVKSQALMNELQCSESTIRRDLSELESKGLLTRIHGGARSTYQLEEELSVSEKSSKNIQEKQTIAKLAASLVKENDVIYIDAGTTTLAMINFLTAKNITVVTNGVAHASLLADKEIQAFLLGGRVKYSTKAVIGTDSLRDLKSYQFNKAFLGTNGIHLEYGYTTPDPDEAALKKTAITQSAMAYMLADDSKWEKVTFSKVGDIEEATIITNRTDRSLTNYQEKTTILEAEQ